MALDVGLDALPEQTVEFYPFVLNVDPMAADSSEIAGRGSPRVDFSGQLR